MNDRLKINGFADIIILLMLLVDIIILSRLYVYYGFDFDETLISVYYLFSILFAVILVYFYICLNGWCNKNKEAVVLLCVSSFTALILAELIVTYSGLFLPTHIKENVYYKARDQGVKYDVRSRLQVYSDAIKNGDEYSLVLTPNLFIGEDEILYDGERLLPLASESNKKLIYCNESGSYSTYSSDKFGFNNDNSIYEERIEIALVGDSFTEGACVNREDNIASHLIRLGKNTINLGKGGSGGYIQRAILNEYAKVIMPKAVVWLFYENDFVEILRESRDEILLGYSDMMYSQNLTKKQDFLDRSLADYIYRKYRVRNEAWWIKTLKLTNLRSQLRNILFGKSKRLGSFDKYHESVDHMYYLIDSIHGLVKSWGGKLFFVYLPSRDTVMGGHNAELHKAVNSIVNKVKSEEVNYINMHDVFMSENLKADQIFPFGLEHHYNSYGYNIVAKQILKLVRED